jgi:hypothetical protein
MPMLASICPQVDVPAHTASWGRGVPQALANCSWLRPLDLSQATNPFKQLDLLALDPSHPHTTALVQEVFEEIAELFPDEYVHVGGDEIDFRCWDTDPRIAAWLRQRGTSSRAELRRFFADAVWAPLAKARRRAVVWQDAFEQGLPLPPGTLVSSGHLSRELTPHQRGAACLDPCMPACHASQSRGGRSIYAERIMRHTRAGSPLEVLGVAGDGGWSGSQARGRGCSRCGGLDVLVPGLGAQLGRLRFRG